VPALIAAGYRAIAIDSRGHGRSTRDERAYSYELMGSDVLAVMDEFGIARAAFVGWSDGACTALVLADTVPARVSGVLFFACNMDPGGTKPFEFTPILGRCISRHKADYAALSATPGDFEAFSNAVGVMQRTQPNYSVAELANIDVPVLVVQSAFDEFITLEHAQYLARAISGSCVRAAARGQSFCAAATAGPVQWRDAGVCRQACWLRRPCLRSASGPSSRRGRTCR
jgi:pimeloyl-ACP methyl ester carboxylesterase